MLNYKNVTPSDCTYTWQIIQLECAPSYEGQKDYVVTVHWRYGASYEKFYSEIYGAQSFSEVSGDNFIPYAELTEDIVIGWLEQSLDVQKMQDQLAVAVENLVNPPIIVLPLPWESPNPPIAE